MSSIFDNSEMKAKLIAKLKEFGYEYKRDLGGGGQGTCYEVMKIKDDIKSKVAVKITLKTDDHGLMISNTAARFSYVPILMPYFSEL